MNAYKFGFIDKDGNRIKKIENEDGKMVPNDPFTKLYENSFHSHLYIDLYSI